MKAAVFQKKNVLSVENVPDPRPESNEIIMKVTYCAICGSDLHRYAHGMMNPGTVMGHEYAGEVVEVGKNVRALKVGDRVTRCGGRVSLGRELSNFEPRYNARERGFMPLKPGAFAQYMAAPEDKVMKTAPEVTDLEASLIEPLTVAVHAARKSGVRLGDRVVVLGAGPIGLFAMQCAALSGAGEVYVSEVNAARSEAARCMGAGEVFHPGQVDVIKEIVARTEIGADVAFECAGAPPTLQQALEIVKMGGTVMVIALAWEQVQCLPVEWVGREVVMRTCYGHLNSEWPLAMALIREKKVQTAPMVSKVIPLIDIQQAFTDLLRPDGDLIQVIVKCN